MENVTDKERKDAKMAVIYELRLLIDEAEKERYTKEEIFKILDTFARTKEID